jgi:riboflavin synthase
MFTGVIEELGKIKLLSKGGRIARLTVLAPRACPQVQIGQSIAVNGVCLTVVKKAQDCLEFEIMQESLGRTNLTFLRTNDAVNLERALKAEARFDGHFVTGHIDGTGRVIKREQGKRDATMLIEAPQAILAQIVPKGSIAVDGVSLTVSGLGKSYFQVSLIPYTLAQTTLGLKKEQDLVNLEGDIMAKYVAKYSRHEGARLDLAFLRQHGFAS